MICINLGPLAPWEVLGDWYRESRYQESRQRIRKEGAFIPWFLPCRISPAQVTASPSDSLLLSLLPGVRGCHKLVVVVQSLSHVQLFVTPWTIAHRAPLSFTISGSLLKVMSTELVMLSVHLILCHPLLLMSPTPLAFSLSPQTLLSQNSYSEFCYALKAPSQRGSSLPTVYFLPLSSAQHPDTPLLNSLCRDFECDVRWVGQKPHS